MTNPICQMQLDVRPKYERHRKERIWKGGKIWLLVIHQAIGGKRLQPQNSPDDDLNGCGSTVVVALL
jgi:hypothetical protein